jgi:hypothetical protein
MVHVLVAHRDACVLRGPGVRVASTSGTPVLADMRTKRAWLTVSPFSFSFSFFSPCANNTEHSKASRIGPGVGLHAGLMGIEKHVSSRLATAAEDRPARRLGKREIEGAWHALVAHQYLADELIIVGPPLIATGIQHIAREVAGRCRIPDMVQDT